MRRAKVPWHCCCLAVLLLALPAGRRVSGAPAALPHQADAPADEGLLLYCAFEGGAEATFARGERSAKGSLPAEFGAGVRGQALVIGGTKGAQRVYDYSPAGNLDSEQGSVSFWLKPLDWEGSNDRFHVVFRTFAGRNFFQVYKFFTSERFLFLRGEQEKWTSVEAKIPDWKPGEWHHVVATWSPAELRMFVDGHLVCARKVRFAFERPDPVAPLSVGPGGWEEGSHGRSLIDEFRIHDHPLGHEEVARLYRQDAAAVAMDAGQITVGRKTPVLDGEVDDGEYAFAGTGFSDLRGMLSPRQSRYFLGYDREHLYVAVSSVIDPARAAGPAGDPARSERVEVFVSPGGRVHHFVFTPEGGFAMSPDGTRWQRAEFGVKSAVHDHAWVVEASIPFAALGAQGAPDGELWRINVGRVFTGPDETTSAAPVVGTLADASKFLTLAFQPDAPAVQITGLVDLAGDKVAMDLGATSGNPNATITAVVISDTTRMYGLRTTSHTLFSGGKPTPFRPGGQPLQDFALSQVRITEKAGGNERLLYRARFAYARQTPMKTLFLYTLERKKLSVSAQRKADGRLQVRFLRPDRSCAWQSSQEIPTNASYFQAVFDMELARLPPGDYTVKVDHVAPDGKATETHEQAYRVPAPDAPECRAYVDVDADKVPAPWTPLESDGDSVRTWGREYRFSEGFLFSSLRSQGREILAGPAVLRLDGQSLAPVRPATVSRVAGYGLRAVWEKSADLGKLGTTSRITTHFDGYCEVILILAPTDKGQEVRSLSLDIPLRADVATLVRDNRILHGGKSGAVSDGWCQSLADGPFLWVGNEKVGFNWLAPDLEGWHCRDNTRNVEILRQGDVAVLRFHLVDTPLVLSASRTIRFGFTLTPSRPLDREILRGRIGKDWQLWCQPWEYFNGPEYDTAERWRVEYDGKETAETFLYLGYGFLSPFCPEWAFWEEEWRDLSTRAYGEWTGDLTQGKQRNANTYTEACIRSDTFRAFRLNGWNRFFTRAKAPLAPKARNYYFDIGVGASRCANARHRCAPWQGADGAAHGRLHIDAFRELALSAYRMIRRTGPDAKIAAHQGWYRAMPMQHFTDVLVGGEGVENEVANKGAYYDILTPEMFRATFLPQTWGIKTGLIHQIVRGMELGRPEQFARFDLKEPETRRAILHAYGYCVLHDVDVWDSSRKTAPVRDALWAAQDRLGWDEKTAFHPYWENDAVRLAGPKSSRILASAYTREGRMLLAILNDTDREERVALALDLAKLGVPAGVKGTDIWRPEDAFVLAPTWEGSVPARGFRLILWPAE